MRLLKPSTFINDKIIQLTSPSSSTVNFFDILNDAAAYVEYYKDQYVFICLDDIILEKTELFNSFIEDLVLLKRLGINPILVHDAQVSINRYSKQYGIDLTFNNHDRFIAASKIEFVEMVVHLINQNIIAKINSCGGRAIGISGKDGGLVEAISYGSKKNNQDCKIQSIPEINCYGKVIKVDTSIIPILESTDIIPVISSVAFHDQIKTIYVDAIDLAKSLAGHITSSTIVFQVDSWIDEIAKNCIDSEISLYDFKEITSKLTVNQINQKVDAISLMLDEVADSAHFINYNICHSLIFDLLSEKKTGCVVF